MIRMRVFGTILAVSFFALILCGAGLLAAHADNGARVSGCPFASTMEASCPLSAIDRLGTFATVLGSLPISAFSLALLLACLVLASSVIALAPKATLPVPFSGRRDDSAVWHPLQLAFSRGILNPKVF